MKIVPNENKYEFDRISQAVYDNDGYCPCKLNRDPSTKCPCLEFREQKTEGYCHCGRFKKEKIPN